MPNVILKEKDSGGIGDNELKTALIGSLSDCVKKLNNVLLVVPDYTRLHSCAGKIAQIYYHYLHENGCNVELLVALGTHVPMTKEECLDMYGEIPFQKFIMHNWRTDVKKIGTVPASFVKEVSGGISEDPIDVEINKKLLQKYNLILSIGQVVPHEVVGMANQSKNIFVGCGGSAMINGSHMLGAFYGMERMMGKDHTPVRKVFDYAQDRFLSEIPLSYVLTVATAPKGNPILHGLYIGRDRSCFEQAIVQAQQKNLTLVEKPFRKVVVQLDEKEFKSTWLGNKAIYRTRMAIADGGELIILAKGIEKFGEDSEIDRLIRKYGYCGRETIIKLCKEQSDLKNNLSAAAHLIHGSSDDRFSITYCTEHLTQSEIEGVCFRYMPYKKAAELYDTAKLRDGYNTLENNEEIYYISNPALGLWANKHKF